MKPTVGRVVHFYEDGQGPFSATIAAVHSDTCCTLSVFKPHQTSVYVASSCVIKEAAAGMTSYWVWPPRD